MKGKGWLAAGLAAAVAFAGGHHLGGKRVESRRIAALEAELTRLEEQTDSQARRLAGIHGKDPDGLDGLDPISRKHLILSMWYLQPERGNYYIGNDMGHAWGPVWNRRSPVSILQEQTEVMRAFLADLRKLEEQAGYPPRYPTEDTVDPADGGKIDWQDHLKAGEGDQFTLIWLGKKVVRKVDGV